MPSSEQSGVAAEEPVVATYSFQQLDGVESSAADIADVLSDAWAQAEQIRTQARAAGEAEGRAAAIAAVQADARPVLSALAAALESLRQLQDELVAELEADAAELAVRLAEQLVSGTIAVQPERIIDVARNSLRHLTERRRVTLVVNPGDLEMMSEAVEGLQSELGGIEHLGVQADRRISRGEAIARTDAGEIDATIDVQLARARDVVVQALAADQDDVA